MPNKTSISIYPHKWHFGECESGNNVDIYNSGNSDAPAMGIR